MRPLPRIPGEAVTSWPARARIGSISTSPIWWWRRCEKWQTIYNAKRSPHCMKKVVERERNKNYYRVLHVPIWIWAFWILPGNLTADLYAHGPDRRHWIWLAIVTA